MENSFEIKNEYNNLDNLHQFLKNESNHEVSKEYDHWDLRTDANGQMEQCLVLKKSNMHALKMHFDKGNTLKTRHVIPSKMMNAYFGKSVKARKNVLELITGVIKEKVMVGSQKKAFNELEQDLNNAKA